MEQMKSSPEVSTYPEFPENASLLSKKAIWLIVITLFLSVSLFLAGFFGAVHKVRSDAAAASAALTKEGASAATEVNLANALRKSTVKAVFEGEAIPAYSTAEVMALDVSKPSGVSVSDLQLVTRDALVGLEEAFWQAEQDYGVNCLFVMAIAAHESANGTMCYRPNNMFGYGGISFDSKEECIDTVARGLAYNYLSPNGSLYSGNTISSVNTRYAASSAWDDRVAHNMVVYYGTISESHNAALEKLK